MHNEMLAASELTAQMHLERVAGEIVYENPHRYHRPRRRGP
jgi:hypothetical protein